GRSRIEISPRHCSHNLERCIRLLQARQPRQQFIALYRSRLEADAHRQRFSPRHGGAVERPDNLRPWSSSRATQIPVQLVQVDTAAPRRLTNKRVNLVTPPGAIQLKD